jgi:hypothetical protein
MKSTISKNNSDLLPYPKLMEGTSGVIVLFWGTKKGVTVNSNAFYSIGHFSYNWDMFCFKEYTGKVTMENS